MIVQSIQPLSDIALLRLYGEVLDELRARQVVRSSNNPVADYAEHLCCQAFGWTAHGNSHRGDDAVGMNGSRYQIKARRLTRFNASRQVSALRGLEEARFDFLAGIVFREDFIVERAALVPHETVLANARYVESWGWRFRLADSLWRVEGVIDVTRELREAQGATRSGDTNE